MTKVKFTLDRQTDKPTDRPGDSYIPPPPKTSFAGGIIKRSHFKLDKACL